MVITKISLDVSLNTIENQLNEQRIRPEKIFRIRNGVTNQEKRLVRVLTKNQAKKTIKIEVVLCLKKFKWKQSKQQPKKVQCLKCRTHGQIAANCENAQRCPRCGGRHHIKDCNQMNYKGCHKYKETKLQTRSVS